MESRNIVGTQWEQSRYVISGNIIGTRVGYSYPIPAVFLGFLFLGSLIHSVES